MWTSIFPIVTMKGTFSLIKERINQFPSYREKVQEKWTLPKLSKQIESTTKKTRLISIFTSADPVKDQEVCYLKKKKIELINKIMDYWNQLLCYQNNSIANWLLCYHWNNCYKKRLIKTWRWFWLLLDPF